MKQMQDLKEQIGYLLNFINSMRTQSKARASISNQQVQELFFFRLNFQISKLINQERLKHTFSTSLKLLLSSCPIKHWRVKLAVYHKCPLRNVVRTRNTALGKTNDVFTQGRYVRKKSYDLMPELNSICNLQRPLETT